MKQYLAFIFLILSMGLVMADTIEDTSVHVKLYNTTLEFTNPDYTANNKIVNFTITNGSVDLNEYDFAILFIKNESVDKTLAEQYGDCIAAKGACDVEKSQFNMGWNICKSDLATCTNNNNESVKQNLNDCNLDKQKMQLDLDAKTKDLNTCNEDIKGNSNSKFIWAAGGGLIVFLIMMFVTGKWGNQNKDKSQEEFNPNRGY
jgi:hypothetical protein